MRKKLLVALNILVVLLLSFYCLRLCGESENIKVLDSIGNNGFVITVALFIIWAVIVVICDVIDIVKYEKKKLVPTLVCIGILVLFSMINEDTIKNGIIRVAVTISIVSIFDYLFREHRRNRVRINNNYNLRECTREDVDFIYELKKEGFEWYIKDLEGWDEEKQREIIHNEMDAHLSDMNIIRYDFEDVGLFTYYEDENKDIFIDMIALMPKARNRGIGSNLLQYLIVNNSNKRLYLRTYKENPARQLYIRKGFVKYDETDTHWWMERKNNS